MGPSRTFLSGHQSSRVVLYVGCVHPSAVLGMTAVGVLVGRGSPHPPSCKALPHVVAEGALVGGAETHTNRLEGGF